MEIKPQNKSQNSNYPNENEMDNKELNKPLKKWKKIGITTAVLAGIGMIGIVYNLKNNVEMYKTPGVVNQESATFNYKFEEYEGNRVKGTKVKQLILNINSSNKSYENDNDKIVSINNATEEAKLLEMSNNVKGNKTYDIKLEYNSDTGLIKNINITESDIEKMDENEVSQKSKEITR